jgi:menaquinone-dependent protoporphyrinogen oxidase
MTQVLVIHASKFGSVEEVARYTAAILREEGAACDVVAARDAVDLEGYDLIVLGTGLYMGRPHRDTRHFLHDHHAALAHQPFAVFALGPLSNEPEEKDKVRPQLEHVLERYPELEPAAIAIFGGVIDPEKMKFPFNHMPEGDYRDWDEIRSFALSLPIPVAATA